MNPQRTTAAAQKVPAESRWAAALGIAGTAVPVFFFALFAAAHFHDWLDRREMTGAGLVVQETLVVALLLVRRTPARSSWAPGDWLLAAGGTFLILAVRPVGRPVLDLGDVFAVIQFCGLMASAISLGVLGRSFGIVAADRGVKTGGPYAIVRHPAYASYFVTQSAYLLQNPTLLNGAIVLVTSACQLGRIWAEERFLFQDPAYRNYATKVRFRLIPGLF